MPLSPTFLDGVMKAILDRLDVQLARHVPDLARRLRPPASPAQIAEVEGLLGCALTDDLRQVYLWHDGALPGNATFEDRGPALFGPFSSWCSLERATMVWRMDKEYWDSDISGSFQDYATNPQFDKGGKLRYWPAVPSAWLIQSLVRMVATVRVAICNVFALP